ncbi:MAG: bifunctional methylenetetrahydrofolate dehydrogenase/methenyltetrahydrofolate cyclohydrolase [Holosporaceae bacterium]|jgi:methylenetetrahydrofolate dehydrogenase (NADP+)/methenyltetrahydrofolate cyclohydrolase|nr:bifunctional methylenetetrahydrofolate dehydrogenase/methenyltetrahydrofolate cyclohydrolase [Holosporaceae bacterium]
MAQLINGKEIANDFCQDLASKVKEVKRRGIFPKIAMINASDDPSSEIYVAKKMAMTKSLGILSEVYKYSPDVTQEELASLIQKLNADASVHGILLQSPLPRRMIFRELVNLIRPDKDVDGLTTINQGRLFSGEPGIVPCTPQGVLHLVYSVHKSIAGLQAVVLGRSSIVGRPLSQLLLNANCTVTLLHSYSKNLPEICKTADILVSAVGSPMFVKRSFIKPGTTVIDVGINRIEENGVKKIVGDVNFEEVFAIAGAITPVPNGVGPMTVSYLMSNVLQLACC